VYRATLRQGGQEVAVKVQRPDVHTLVACDLFLLRIAAAPLLSRLGIFAGVSSMVALVDELGARFVNELDYTLGTTLLLLYYCFTTALLLLY
jgi:aarF domain-containing kinase